MNLSKERILGFPFLLPSLDEQRAIAHILGTLDDKIELNRRMSETLEAIARALFKSWFVDFEPVRAKAEGRDPGLPKELAELFSGSIARSEIGEMPEGWTIQTFADVVEQLRDNEQPFEWPDVVFDHFSLPAFDQGQAPVRERGSSIKSQKTRVPPGVVLLSKLNPDIERVWLVDVQPGKRPVCSTEFLVLRSREPFGRAFVYCLCRFQGFRRELEALVTGTSKSHQRVRPTAVLGLRVVAPSQDVVREFERLAAPLLERTLLARRELSTLAALRNALLPKLVSGELWIEDARAELEPVQR
jgi:type I restriction enzyme S subunit